ncbi:MAG: hypothetical protein V1798_07875 [Pseudomonadota bacterium]
MSAGTCSSQATLVSLVPHVATIQALVAYFHDDRGREVRLQGPVGLFGIGPEGLVIPAQGTTTASISFDLSAGGLSAPIHGDVVITGVYETGAVDFTGSLQCQ